MQVCCVFFTVLRDYYFGSKKHKLHENTNDYNSLQLQNGISLPTAKESTVQPSNSFVLSKQMLKQTKAQVMESNSNYTVIKPQQQQQQNSEKMLEEYMSKLNQMEDQKTNGISKPDLKPKKSESSDNILTNEFMRVREEKFGKVLSENLVEKENQKNLAKSAKVQQQRMNTASTTTSCKPNENY